MADDLKHSLEPITDRPSYYNPQWGRFVEIPGKLHAMMTELGFDPWHTGGGCMAWGKNLNDDGDHVMLSVEGFDLGEDKDIEKGDWSVGRYAGDNDRLETFAGSLHEALVLAERLPRPVEGDERIIEGDQRTQMLDNDLWAGYQAYCASDVHDDPVNYLSWLAAIDDDISPAPAATAPAPEAAVAPVQTVYVLTIDHRPGQDISVHATDEGANAELARYCDQQWWDETDKKPTDPDDLIIAYFERIDYAETYEIRALEVQS